MSREPGVVLDTQLLSLRAYRFHSNIRVVAVIITAFLIIVEVLVARRLPDQPYTGMILNNLTVARIAARSPAANSGLQKGDEIISVGGVQCTSIKEISEWLSHARPGDSVAYRVARGGSVFSVDITMTRLPFSEILRKASLLLVGFSFITIGLVVYFRRADKIALVFYLLCLTFGLALINVINFELVTARDALRSSVQDLVVFLLPALFLHFFLLFPRRSLRLVRRPGLECLIYLPASLLFAISVFFNIMLFAADVTYPAAVAALQFATAIYFVAFLVTGLVAFVHGYRQSGTAKLRRKLRLVVWGTIAGTVPLLSVHIVLSIKPVLEIPGEKLVFLPLILVPVAFGHAIVRYGLLDLEIVFKRSLVYTLLTAVLASVYFIVVYGIGRLASRFMGSADLLFSVISIFVITLLISPLRSRIRAVVDRTFFRQEYNYRMILKQISHSLAGLMNIDSLVSYVTIRVAEVLDATTAVVFLIDDRKDAFTARYGVGIDHAMLRQIDRDGPLSNYLRQARVALNVQRKLASNRPLPISHEERDVLKAISSALVVPFVLKANLLGFISIGSKRSDEYYSATDIELLETLCDQVALAIENTRLHEETLEKHRIEKELEVAREIQHRLLPKTLPRIPGLDSSAINKPSKHVGGDYYDVVVLSRAKVGIVIADVSGKGVPAALLMACLQSSLRSEADASKAPWQVISALNQVIYEHTFGGTFVTIFYAVIDFDAGTLTYCNAGQTPPLILGTDQSFKTLDETDIVIGVEPGASYRDTIVEIKPGDLIFLYTDGITDELDANDEPYGEARLKEDLIRCRGLGLEEILSRIHEAVTRHTGGKPQDDLTALAIRMQEVPTLSRRTTREAKKA